MKVKHWIFLLLIVVGGLYLIHNYASHGGTKGLKSGLGLGGFGG